jgi:beta-lactamase regulating signal transducer with metallopeptidase domain
MIDYLLQIAVSNVCISLVLALAAWTVQLTCNRPRLANLLWLVVLVKLVTPPLISLPVLPVAAASSEPVSAIGESGSFEGLPASVMALSRSNDIAERSVLATCAAFVQRNGAAFGIVWLVGGVGILLCSVIRVYRFNRLLSIASSPAGPDIQHMAAELSKRIGLKRTPTISTTSARISPMVWWFGGRLRVVIPAELPEELNRAQLRLILAHELAHVRRRDHLVRWLEWLACVGFWWNPVAWWARRNLRINEEMCCDAVVLSQLQPEPRAYAGSLMTVVEFLASPVIRPPAMASEINSGGFLERRFKMIMTRDAIATTPRWLQAGAVIAAATLLPLGLAFAQEGEAKTTKADCNALGAELRVAIQKGELTAEAAKKQYMAECGDHEHAHRPMSRVDIEKAAQEIEQAVATGKLTEEEGMEKLEWMRRQMVERTREKAIWEHVDIALTAAGIAEANKHDVMDVVKKLSAEMKTQGETFELDAEFTRTMAVMELNDQQIEMIMRISRRIASRSNHGFEERIAGALIESGIPREDIAAVMGTLRPIVMELREEGDAFELDPAVQDALEALDLSGEQIELVIDLAQRLSTREGGNPHGERIAGALLESGVTRENMEPVMGSLHSIIGEINEEGDTFVLDPTIKGQLEDLGLTAEQIELVVEIAHRMIEHEGVQRREREEMIRQRIEGAVERGMITREEADAKLDEIRQRQTRRRREQLEQD